MKTLLVIDSSVNFLSLFEGVDSITYLDPQTGEEKKDALFVCSLLLISSLSSVLYINLQVEQAAWEDIGLSAYSETGVVVVLQPAKKPFPGTKQHAQRFEDLSYFSS